MRKELIVIGADHAGFALKEFIREVLAKEGYRIRDVGAYRIQKGDDYPDYAEKVALAVAGGRRIKGILACGTGIGASIAANKVPGARAALACNAAEARLAREHNNANILVLGGRPFYRKTARRMVHAWLRARFAGGRHARRLRKITKLERVRHER